MILLIPRVNSLHCFSMYDRNASERHLPTSIIMYGGMPCRYSCIARADLFECVPVSSGPKPNVSLPMSLTALLISSAISLFVIGVNFFVDFEKNVNIGQSSL